MIVSNTWDMATLVIQFKTMRQVHIENALLLGLSGTGLMLGRLLIIGLWQPWWNFEMVQI